MIKKQISIEAALIPLLSAYWAIETPITLTFLSKTALPLVAINVLVSCFFLFHYFKLLHQKEEGMKVKNSTWLFLAASLPYDLFSFAGIPGAESLSLLKLVHMFSLWNFYHDMNSLMENPKPFKLLVILSTAIVSIHLVAMTWININPAMGLSPSETYIKALYWAVTTLTTTGYGDITPVNDAGRLFNVFVMLLGFSAFGIIVGNISNLIIVKNRHAEANRERMEDLALFMQYYEVPRDLRLQIYNYNSYRMKKRLSENDAQIIADLPHALQNDLQIYMKIKLIGTIPIFQNLSRQCLKEVALALHPRSFSGGDALIKKGESGNEMYILDHGEVEVLNEKNEVIALLKHGQCFGEIALLKDIQRTADVRARSFCDVYVLKREDFDKISETFPELTFSFMKVMNRRMQSAA